MASATGKAPRAIARPRGAQTRSVRSAGASPLWVISLFVSLTEVIAGVAATQTAGAVQVALTGFVITFPVLIAAGFFTCLWARPWVLYSPNEYDRTDVTRFVGAIGHRTRRADALVEGIQKEIDAAFNSSEVVAAVSRKLAVNTGEPTEAKVADALATVARPAVQERIRNHFVTIDVSRLSRARILIRYPVEPQDTVSQFLDFLWWEINRDEDGILPAFTYGERWVLRDPTLDVVYDTLGSRYCVTANVVSDDRTLESVGIFGGTTLEVLPLTKGRGE